MKILGIETSCDETSASVAVFKNKTVKILSNIVSSQIDIHKKYGGVVPEVAARAHVGTILPVVEEALIIASAKQHLGSHPLPPMDKRRGEFLDGIAVTQGPGLVASLMVGIETAKTLAFVWRKPIYPINHVEGHIYANFIENKNIEFPALVLTVSGGHTMLVLMKDHGKYKTIGNTRDDAAGEAFDKTAKLLGVGYPGGPAIARLASQYKIPKNKTDGLNFPRPMINSKDYDFSFSGLKTAVLYKAKKDKNFKNRLPEYAYELQRAIVDVLIKKTIKAAEEFQVKTVMLSGGVSANLELRSRLENIVRDLLVDVRFVVPDLTHTTDNAAMIAAAGCFKAQQNRRFKPNEIKVSPNYLLED